MKAGAPPRLATGVSGCEARPVGNFSRSVRILACPSCAAPLDVPLDGGHVACPYCNTRSDWAPRRPAEHRAPSHLDDQQRLQRLEAQRQAPQEQPPPSVLVHQQLNDDPAKARALQALATAKQQYRSGGGADAEAQIYWLTVLLYNAYTGPANSLRQRGLIEAGLEVLDSPRRRQALHGMLARNAAREGDHHAASEWLALMDPRSDDLPTESAYRLTLAYLQTARRAYGDVLATLGDQIGAVPMAGNDELFASVIRANAIEYLGDPARGASQLVALMQLAPHFPQLVRSIIRANLRLAMCPQGLPTALQHVGAG